jgi:hypothetical protein
MWIMLMEFRMGLITMFGIGVGRFGEVGSTAVENLNEEGRRKIVINTVPSNLPAFRCMISKERHLPALLSLALRSAAYVNTSATLFK